MPKSHNASNLHAHITRVSRATHPHVPEGGSSGLLPIDYQGVPDLAVILEALGPPSQEMIMAKQSGARRQDRIERRSLRAYHTRAAELIAVLVNQGWCTVRLAPNSLILYPIDGSSPYTVNARKDDREHKMLVQWASRHTTGDGNPLGVTGDQIKQRLAEVINDPHEHPAPAEHAVPRPPKRKPEAPVFTERKEPKPVEDEPEPEWRPYLSIKDQAELPNWETDGTYIRCRLCVRDEIDPPYKTTEPASLGGHIRMSHNREGLDTPEARAKATDTRRYDRLRAQVEEGVQFLSHSIGYTPVNAERLADLEADVQILIMERDEALENLDAVTKERDELQAWVELLPGRKQA